jgi:hypothetical protein
MEEPELAAEIAELLARIGVKSIYNVIIAK